MEIFEIVVLIGLGVLILLGMLIFFFIVISTIQDNVEERAIRTVEAYLWENSEKKNE